MDAFRTTPSSKIILAVCVLLASMTQGCDRAVKFQFENRTNETIFIDRRDDHEDSFSPEITLPPHTATESYVMIWGTGVRIRGVSESSGKVMLDRHIVWDELEPDDRILVIGGEGSTPTMTPVKERN